MIVKLRPTLSSIKDNNFRDINLQNRQILEYKQGKEYAYMLGFSICIIILLNLLKTQLFVDHNVRRIDFLLGLR